MSGTKLFQLYDLTAGNIDGPILAYKREAPAIRDFHELLSRGDKSGTPGRYPETFNLVLIGSQDEDTGIITPLAQPDIVATGADWKRAQEKASSLPFSLQHDDRPISQ